MSYRSEKNLTYQIIFGAPILKNVSRLELLITILFISFNWKFQLEVNIFFSLNLLCESRTVRLLETVLFSIFLWKHEDDKNIRRTWIVELISEVENEFIGSQTDKTTFEDRYFYDIVVSKIERSSKTREVLKILHYCTC